MLPKDVIKQGYLRLTASLADASLLSLQAFVNLLTPAPPITDLIRGPDPDIFAAFVLYCRNQLIRPEKS